MLRNVTRFLDDESGSTSIEYAVIAGFLSIAIVTAVSDLGGRVVEFFTAVKESF